MSRSVAVFWDFENCPIPTQRSGFEVVSKLRDAFLAYGPVRQFKAYLSLWEQSASSRSIALRSELQLAGITLVDVPHSGRKNAVDLMMIVDMMAFCMDCSLSTTLVLLTADRDFAYLVATLRLRGFTVILVSPLGPSTHPSLRLSASRCLNLNDILGSSPMTRDPLIDLPSQAQITTSPIPTSSNSSFSFPTPKGQSYAESRSEQAAGISGTPPNQVRPPMQPPMAPLPHSEPLTEILTAMSSKKSTLSDASIDSQPDSDATSTACLANIGLAIRLSPEPDHAAKSSSPPLNLWSTQRMSGIQASTEVVDPSLPESPTPVEAWPGSPSPVPAVFKPLIELLQEHEKKNLRPFPTVISASIEAMCPEIYRLAKVAGWHGYVLKAAEERLISVTWGGASNEHILGIALHPSLSRQPPTYYGQWPSIFLPLVRVLEQYRRQGFVRPERSKVGATLVGESKDLYRSAGVGTFKEYTLLAEREGLIELGGKGGSAWIALQG